MCPRETGDDVVLGVGTTGEYTTWHVFCDLGDVLQLKVDWSVGSGYYMYGFDILVEDADDTKGHEEA